MKKKVQAANVALLIVVGTIILIILGWLIYSLFIDRHSTVFCEEGKYRWINYSRRDLFVSFNKNLCKADCIDFCTMSGYEYKEYYQVTCKNPEVRYSCGCRCG